MVFESSTQWIRIIPRLRSSLLWTASVASDSLLLPTRPSKVGQIAFHNMLKSCWSLGLPRLQVSSLSIRMIPQGILFKQTYLDNSPKLRGRIHLEFEAISSGLRSLEVTVSCLGFDQSLRRMYGGSVAFYQQEYIESCAEWFRSLSSLQSLAYSSEEAFALEPLRTVTFPRLTSLHLTRLKTTRYDLMGLITRHALRHCTGLQGVD